MQRLPYCLNKQYYIKGLAWSKYHPEQRIAATRSGKHPHPYDALKRLMVSHGIGDMQALSWIFIVTVL